MKKALTFIALIGLTAGALAAPIADGTYEYQEGNNNGTLLIKKGTGDNYRILVEAVTTYNGTFDGSYFDHRNMKLKNGVLAYRNVEEGCDVQFIPKGKTIDVKLNLEVGNCGAGARSSIEGTYKFQSRKTPFNQYNQ